MCMVVYGQKWNFLFFVVGALALTQHSATKLERFKFHHPEPIRAALTNAIFCTGFAGFAEEKSNGLEAKSHLYQSGENEGPR